MFQRDKSHMLTQPQLNTQRHMMYTQKMWWSPQELTDQRSN